MEPQVNRCNIERANVAVSVRVLKVRQNLLRFTKLLQRQIVLSGGNIGFAQEPSSKNEAPVLIQFDALTQLLLGFVEISRVVIHPPKKRSIDRRKGLELARLPAIFNGLFVGSS